MAHYDDRRPASDSGVMACALCDSVSRRVNELRLLGLLDCATYRCESCGLYFRHPLPDEATMARYYEGRCFRYPEDLERRMAEIQGRWIAHAVRGDGGDLRSMSYVEFGCGRGWLVAFMQDESVASTIGYDPDRDSVAWGRRVLGADLRQGVLAGAPTKEDDRAKGAWMVSLVHVLEHIHSPATVIEALCARFHQPYLFIEVPDAAWEGRIMELDTSPDSSMGQHFWSFTQRSLELLLSRVGYSVVAIQRDGKPRFWEEGRRKLELRASISDVFRAWRDRARVPTTALATTRIAAKWVASRARSHIERLTGNGCSRLDLPVIRILAKPAGRTAAKANRNTTGASEER
jgi:hypothetical protein